MIPIIIATTKSWNINRAKDFIKANKHKYKITLITRPKDLQNLDIKIINPKYIFFPHWSWIIPKKIHEVYDCVVFHITDLPFGRGGTPLQNLISRGIYSTKISALKVDEGLDTGPIYFKKNLTIKIGNAEEILTKVSTIIFQVMIPTLLEKNLTPKPQKGKVISFSRRKPIESNIQTASLKSIDQLHDFIRMLDGEGYPAAFIDLDNDFRITFKEAKLKHGEVTGKFKIFKELHE